MRKGAHLETLQAWKADDRIFCGMPFFWVGGVAMTVVPVMSVGAAILCIDRTEPVRALDLMERESATKLTGWPGVVGPITTHPTAAARNIPALVGPVSLVGARHSSLGMTETLASYTYSTPEDQHRPLPDAERGEVVAALVVPVPDTAVEPVELRQRSRRQLSNFKVPRYVVLAADPEVPMRATGKPDRLRIREMLAASKPGAM